MHIVAELSLYPLAVADLTEPIYRFVDHLRKRGLDVRIGNMSTQVAGESRLLFEAIAEAFENLAARYQCVLTAKFSNACPWPARPEPDRPAPAAGR